MAFWSAFCFLLLSFSAFAQVEKLPIEMRAPSIGGYISLSKEEPISNSTYLYIRYALEDFRKKQVSFVLLDLDTPGGEVFAALRIVEELRKMDEQYGIPVIALVDNWAISAGALLAYSCRYIGATELSSMGAAEPVTISSDGKMETASEKMISALRVEFAKTAEFYGRNPLLAEAMVDKDVILVFREGSIVKLLTDTQILETDKVINAKGKLLTLNGVSMKEFGVTNFFLDSKPSTSLVGKELLERSDLLSHSVSWVSYTNWKVDFFAFLSHPFISSLLILGLMAGVYGAIQSQGMGFSSILALSCLSLILLSTFSVQMIGWLELLFLFLGLGFLIVDFACFGFGFLGGFGILLAIFGLFTLLLPSLDGSKFSFSHEILFEEGVYRLTLFLSSVILACLTCLLMSRLIFHRSIFMKRLILKDVHFIREPEKKPAKGSIGTSYSAFRPFGKVEISGMLYEAESDGPFIESGKLVEVVSIKGRIVVVREKIV